MSESKKTGPEAGAHGVVEDIKGKVKEAAGAAIGKDQFEDSEGRAQQDKAAAERDVAAKEAEAEKAHAEAEAHEAEQRAHQRLIAESVRQTRYALALNVGRDLKTDGPHLNPADRYYSVSARTTEGRRRFCSVSAGVSPP